MVMPGSKRVSLVGQGATLYDDRNRPYNAEYATRGQRSYATSDIRKVEKVLKLVEYGHRQYRPFFERMEQAMHFGADRQWSKKQLNYAEKMRRVLLTLNVMRPYTKHLSGLQRKSRSKIKVGYVGQTKDPELADIAEKVIDHVYYGNNQNIIDTEVFNDGMCGIGDWHIWDDYTENFMGDVLLERANPFTVIHDPEALQKLQGDLKWQNRLAYFRADELKMKYGAKLSHLSFNATDYLDWWEELIERLPMFENMANVIHDVRNGLYIVIENYERKVSKQLWVVDQQGNPMFRFKRDRQDVAAFHEMGTGLFVIERKVKQMHRTTILPFDYTVLDEQVFDTDKYPYVSFLSYRDGQKIPDCSSYNQSLIGLQREVNMRRSNMQEAVVKSLRGGYWVFKAGGGKALLEQMDREGHKTGKNFYVDGAVGQEPKPIIPSDIVNGLHFLEENALQYFEKVTGLSVQSYGGLDSKSESGVHRAQRREETMTTLLPILEDFDHAKGLVAETVLDMKIKQMNVPLLLRTIGKEDEFEEYELGEEMITRLKQIKKFDIRIQEGPFAVSQRESEQQERLALTEFTVANHGPNMVEAGAIWKHSNLPEGKEVGDAINERQRAELSPPEEEETVPALPPGVGGEPPPIQ